MDDKEYEFRYDLGIGQMSSSVTLSNQVQIVDCMCKHFSILNIKAELDQILCGLSSTINMLFLIREHPKKFRPLLVHTPVDKVSGDVMYALFKPVLSPDGSNRREAEELVLMWWAEMIYYIEGKVGNDTIIIIMSFIINITECNGLVEVTSPSGSTEEFGLSLEHILIFSTGAADVPPIGFLPKPSITFHESSTVDNKGSPFPSANTCTNCLKLPLNLASYDTFRYNFVYGVVNTAGFGQV